MRWHTPLVPKEDVDLAPVYPVHVIAGQDPVHGLRCRAACEHYGETSALLDDLIGPGRALACGGRGELFLTTVDVDAQKSSISTALRRDPSKASSRPR